MNERVVEENSYTQIDESIERLIALLVRLVIEDIKNSE